MSSPERKGGRPWRRVRAQVLRRDPYCQIRGPKCTNISTTVDHIVPLTRGGAEFDPNNLRGACGPCNYGAGAVIANSRARGRTGPLTPDAALRQTFQGPPCPVSNHGIWCMGGHLVPPQSWQPWWGSAPTWPDGEFAPQEPSHE